MAPVPLSDPTAWDGVGLPPAARTRIARAAESAAAGSLLSAAETTALAGVGFHAVGEVMGCMVQHIGWTGLGCGYTYGRNDARTISSGDRSNRWSGLAPFMEAFYRGWDTALRRLLQEAAALGADGVVGIQLSQQHLGSDNREFLALGTAVRGTGPRATKPFTTDLSGTHVAKLLHAGWVPTGLAIGIAAAVRHDDYGIRRQTYGMAANTEVDGYTDLVNVARHDARTQFDRRARASGGEVALLSGMRLKIWEREPNEGHRDRVAQATVMGTAATAFRRGASEAAPSLSILPLHSKGDPR